MPRASRVLDHSDEMRKRTHEAVELETSRVSPLSRAICKSKRQTRSAHFAKRMKFSFRNDLKVSVHKMCWISTRGLIV
jgi:hypothetical protein